MLCLTACDYNAIYLENESQRDFLHEIKDRIAKTQKTQSKDEPIITVFICERSLDFGKILTPDLSHMKNFDGMPAIPVTCIGVINDTIIKDTFEFGANGMVVIGCRTLDCHYREGMRQEESIIGRYDAMGHDHEHKSKLFILRVSPFEIKELEEEIKNIKKELKGENTNASY